MTRADFRAAWSALRGGHVAYAVEPYIRRVRAAWDVRGWERGTCMDADPLAERARRVAHGDGCAVLMPYYAHHFRTYETDETIRRAALRLPTLPRGRLP